MNVVNAPDNRSEIVASFGDQDLTGFLEMVGAVNNVGEADEVTWWEDTRLHPVQVAAVVATAAAATTLTYPASTVYVRANDIVLLEDGSTRAFVKTVTSTGYTVASFTSSNLPAITATGSKSHYIVGNMYAQGTEQPTEFYESNIRKYTNPFLILKDIYKVTGSQATNKAWVTINGQPYYYLKSQLDFNKRFKNWRETALLMGKLVEGTATANISAMDGSEGYFSAIENSANGGIVSPLITSITMIDDIIDEMDVQGGVSDEYAAFLSRAQFTEIDDLLSFGNATSLTNGLPSQFGTVQNSADMAVTLGFKSFTRGGRTFHMKGWRLLNDSTMLKNSDYKGVLVPTGMVVDGKSGKYVPALEMNYKSANGENRLLKSWVTGSVLGASNATIDNAQFNYLSEVNLVTRARNQHVLIKAS